MAKTYNDHYLETRRILKEAGIDAYSLEARIIVAHAAGKPMDKFMRELHFYTADDMDETVAELVGRRLAGEPVAYITGSWEFYGLPMEVGPDVLIPRMDTEVLAETAIKNLKGKSDVRVLDLCSGSGCLGCAIAHELPSARVVMVDSSPAALRISKNNVLLNGLSPRVTCIQADVFDPPPSILGSFDLVVCNPPYIPTGELKNLDPSVRDYEPLSALDGGEDGLDFYRAVLKEWKSVIRETGSLMFEVGIGQAEEVKKMMRLSGFKAVEGIYDTGGIERVITGRL
ncbi:MAG TPA: peptide chain release factor N(5)-glutamine methyltransferase [Clostridiales bacterium]|nr:peptide chain release factor N(5)-glutamine methyltransferase [Clostridiales bacterium]